MRVNRGKEDYVQAVWFATGMAVLVACFERAVIISIFEQWRVWVFLVLNLLLLAILFTSSTCSPTSPLTEGNYDFPELKIEVVAPPLAVEEEDVDRGGIRKEKENGGIGEDEERKSKEDLNERVEAFIAMFRQHLVSDANGTTTSRRSFHSVSRKECSKLIVPLVCVQY